MNAQAIIYSSHAGHTQAYAQMLSAQLGIPTFPLSSCTLKENTEVVYLGWLRAGQVVGLSQALRRYTVLAIGVVGMSRLDQGRIARMKKKEGVTDGVYCFLPSRRVRTVQDPWAEPFRDEHHVPHRGQKPEIQGGQEPG